MRKFTLLMTLFLLSLLATACQPSRQPDPTATMTRPPLPTVTQTATPTVTPTPLPTATPTNTPTPTPMSSAAIFDQVSPAIAFIETPAGTGSGLLIEGGYVVTNAHVVWPFQEVRVVFPDGSEYQQAPVLKWNLMADLAVVGPIETTIAPVVLADGEAEVVGSDVYLIGYPGEVEAFPRPAITRGLISRVREWEALNITYFQTDATIAGGQSGGVLVNQKAQVIGISGFYFTEAMFGLVASVADVQPLIQEMTTDEAVSIQGGRMLPVEGGQQEQEVWLWNGEVGLFIANSPAGDDLQVQVESEVETALEIVDVYGTIVAESASSQAGRTTASTTAMIAAPHFVVVYALGGETTNRFRVSSNQPLIPYDDWDDFRRLLPNQTLDGLMDYPGDYDYFTVTLVKGQTVHVTLDSLLLDPYLAVMYDNWDTAVEDDDSGGGLFGLNAGLTYQAPHSGEYYIYVADATGYYVGGYQIQVGEPAAGAPTPMAVP
ncbi:MAG: serine protease, partial [Chloroflexota bacterium]